MNINQFRINKKKTQSGFTLIEMAVVMVIIGFLLGSGVLLSQSLIRGMHTKEVMTLAKDISAASQYFKEKYHYLPGDLPLAANKIPGIGASCSIDPDLGGPAENLNIGNGLIDTTTESACAVEHLALAGFITSDSQSGLSSRYGEIKIVANSSIKNLTCSELNTNWASTDASISSYVQLPSSFLNVIEFYNLPWDVAKELDRNMDDGNLTYPTESPLPDPVPNSSLVLGGTIQVDTDCDTVGNQDPGSNMVSDIPYLTMPL